MFQPTEEDTYEANFGSTVVQFQYGYNDVILTGKCIVKWHCGNHDCDDVMLHVPGHSYWIDDYSKPFKVVERLNALIIKQFELDGIEYQRATEEMGKNESVSETARVTNVSRD